MNYKAYLYVITLFLSIFAISGINFDGFIRKNKAIEARILAVLLSICCSYLVTNFITDFLSTSTIIRG